MKISIIGGGINGLCTAWKLAEAGYIVDLFERGMLLGETSRSSSKLLHGGIRYLENFEFRLVMEALKERDWWISNVPEHAKMIKLCMPVYDQSSRRPWKLKLGFSLYDLLAWNREHQCHQMISAKFAASEYPDLQKKGLVGAFIFFDGQMDEGKLGAWVVDRAVKAGVKIHENIEVKKISIDGKLSFSGSTQQYDYIVNAAGPWSSMLNDLSSIKNRKSLDLVRGSHIILNRKLASGFLFEVPKEKRIFFVLPYKGKTLIGTTEVRQTIHDPILCSLEEKDYLLAAYNLYFINQAFHKDIVEDFAGIRPLILSSKDAGSASRDYALEWSGCVLTIFGGKWTTSRALAKKVVHMMNVRVASS